ncbi:hypothetical protein BJ170DRAFT_684682 [Xylariales sp. AK1849]|nr:hypothetical protein BJ170DRAFT_684682 [Xylariales sp. AK1849]
MPQNIEMGLLPTHNAPAPVPGTAASNNAVVNGAADRSTTATNASANSGGLALLSPAHKGLRRFLLLLLTLWTLGWFFLGLGWLIWGIAARLGFRIRDESDD